MQLVSKTPRNKAVLSLLAKYVHDCVQTQNQCGFNIADLAWIECERRIGGERI